MSLAGLFRPNGPCLGTAKRRCGNRCEPRKYIEMQLNLSDEERAALTYHLCEHVRHPRTPIR